MANIKSAKKRILTNEKRRIRNKSRISSMKTAIKKVNTSIEKNQAEILKVELPRAISILGKLGSKGVIHKNKAARLVSRLTRRANTVKG